MLKVKLETAIITKTSVALYMIVLLSIGIQLHMLDHDDPLRGHGGQLRNHQRNPRN